MAKKRSSSCAACARSYQRGKQDIPVLEGIDLDIPEGSFEALMGPSGSGKTTLLNLIAGIDQPDGGHGRGRRHRPDAAVAKASWRRGASRNIGFIFQFYNLMPVLTAFENVELPLLLTNLSKAERREARRDRAARRRPRGPHGPLSAPALGRSGAARGHRARHRHRSDDPRRRRADRRSRSQERRGDPRSCSTCCTRKFNKTIVMVTHDPAAAERPSIIRRLDKGQLADGVERRRTGRPP